MECLLIISFGLMITHYTLFPLFIYISSLLLNNQTKKADITPRLSLVIAAYNEEKVIEEKIINSLNLDYPEDKIEIIIVADGSNDQTAEIVSKHQSTVKLIYRPEREGKSSALNRALREATGEIVCFSDANSMFEQDALLKLTRHFYDKQVGGVCGRKNVIDTNSARASSKGDSFYWNIESFIKEKESITSSIVNGDGEIFAIRKSLFKEINRAIINDDQAITFDILNKGFRVIYDSSAITSEEASITLKDDFAVKARMVYGGYQIMSYYYKFFLKPKQFGFTLKFFVHKVLRYIMPFLLISTFTTSLLLIEKYYILFALQLVCYFLAVIGSILEKYNKRPPIFYIPMYYVVVNLAALKGFYFFLKQKKQTTIWTRALR